MTVAPTVPCVANVASSAVVAVPVTESTDATSVGDANAPSFAPICATVCDIAKLVRVAWPAISENPSLIVASVTVSGTAYTVCVFALDGISRLWPVGADTVTPNVIDPVWTPSFIDVTTTVPLAYVYCSTAPGTSTLPTYTFTAPVGATVVAGLASRPCSVNRTDVYVAPAANPCTS